MKLFTYTLFFLLLLTQFCFSQWYQQNNQPDDYLFAGVKISGLFDEMNGVNQAKETFDTLYSFPSPGSLPSGLAWDGQYLWNCDANSEMIYKLTTTGNVVTSFSAPDYSPSGLEWDGNYLWLASEQLAILYKIDTATGLPIEQFQLPSFGDPDPNGFGLAWDGQFLWHSEYSDSARIYKLDPQNGQVVGSFVPPRNSILGITWAEGFLYGISIEFALSGGYIFKFDPSTGSVLDSAFWEIPYPLGLTWDGSYFWNVSSFTGAGGNERIYKAGNPLTSVDDKISNNVSSFILKQNYPNPFNPSTSIQYAVSSKQFVSLKIYDLLGNEVTTLVNEEIPAGTYEITWYAEGLPSGVYFYQLRTGSFIETKKMVLVK